MLLASQFLLGQTQTVRGKIIDQDSQIPLIGATIQLLSNNPIGTTTDLDGKFELKDIPTGRQSFIIQYLGYEPQQLEEIVVTPSKEVILNIGLQESVTQLDIVEVKASQNAHEALNEMSLVSARSMTIEELNRTPANFYDPARMAIGFMGVASAGDDVSNEIVVRGNSPAGILWRIEGIEVPNPNHFSEAGTAGGGISMLSTNAMGTSDFFAGAFPSEFGNATSGVFDIKMRNGNSSATEAAIQLGVLGLNAAIEGPIKKGYDGSYLLNYRYSTLGILESLGILPVGEGTPDFQDLSFKVRLPTKEAGTFSLFGLGGKFISEEDYESAGDQRRDVFRGKTGIVGLSHLLNLSNKTYLKTVVATTYADRLYDEGRLGLLVEDEIDNDYKEFFADKVSRASVLLNHKFNANHVVRIGGIYSYLSYDLKLEDRIFEWIMNEQGNYIRKYSDNWVTQLEGEGNTNTFQTYFQWKYNINERLTLNTGLHFFNFGLNGNHSLEPRLGLNWRFAPKQSLAIGIGRHSKIESISTYFVRRENEQGQVTFPNKDLPLQKATHYILSYQLGLAKKLNFKMEAYYQAIDNLAISSVPNSTVALMNRYYFDVFSDIPSLIGEGKGRNYGVDLSLEKGFSKNYYFVLNASIFNSEYQTNTKEWYQSKFSSNYNIVLIGGKEFNFNKKRKHTLGINGKIIINGGQRYTPINEIASLAAKRSIYEETPFTKHLPAYWRADLGVNWSWYKKRVVHAISLNIQNVTNRENVQDRVEFYRSSEHRVITRNNLQASIIPVLSYRLEF
jgi:hypothetical protein